MKKNGDKWNGKKNSRPSIQMKTQFRVRIVYFIRISFVLPLPIACSLQLFEYVSFIFAFLMAFERCLKDYRSKILKIELKEFGWVKRKDRIWLDEEEGQLLKSVSIKTDPHFVDDDDVGICVQFEEGKKFTNSNPYTARVCRKLE